MVNRFFTAVFFMLLMMPLCAAGQRAMGVDWSEPEKSSDAATQLQHYADIGISHLQIHQPLDSKTWEQIKKLEFTVFGQLPVRFPVSETFSEADSAFLDSLNDITTRYNQQSSVKAIGVFSYGAENNAAFKRALSEFTGGLKSKTDKPLYYTSAYGDGARISIDSLYTSEVLRLPSPDVSAKNAHATAAFTYLPPDDVKWNPVILKNMLEQTAGSPQRPFFLESYWLRGMENRYPNFGKVLSTYTAGDPVFPLPEEPPKPFSKASAIALMLLLAWVLFAVTYSYDPVYRKSLVRYFTGHRFFVDDVMKRHIRSPFSGGSILVQHAISGGIIVYTLFSVFFSSLGYEALLWHYPLLPEPDAGGLDLFFWGCLLTFGFQLISIIWLWAAHSGISSVTQIINLYTWPLQLNLFGATLISLFFLSGLNIIFIKILSIIFILFFALSFVITAADTGRFIKIKKLQYYILTTGVYLSGLITLAAWIYSSNSLQNVIELAASLP